MHSRSNWNLEVLVLEERGKAEYPDKNLSEQRNEPTTNLTQALVSVLGFEPVHIGGRRLLSPLSHPCSPDSSGMLETFQTMLHVIRNDLKV